MGRMLSQKSLPKETLYQTQDQGVLADLLALRFLLALELRLEAAIAGVSMVGTELLTSSTMLWFKCSAERLPAGVAR